MAEQHAAVTLTGGSVVTPFQASGSPQQVLPLGPSHGSSFEKTAFEFICWYHEIVSRYRHPRMRPEDECLLTLGEAVGEEHLVPKEFTSSAGSLRRR
jgi:hypothetical protein